MDSPPYRQAQAQPNPYLANLVLSASPAQLIALLYDGLIRFLNAALEGFSETDPQFKIETIHNNLIRAQNIVTELRTSLDPEKGGDFALQLDALYSYFSDSLCKINTTKDPSLLPKIIEMVTELRDSWHQVANLPLNPENHPSPETANELV
jgi:flagellar protein FliS